MNEKVNEIGKTMGKDTAREWVRKYEKENPEAVRGWLYGRDILEKMCNYPNAEGIWFFKGINDDGEERLVLFPADADGNILNNKIKSIGAAGVNDDPVDAGETCPPKCPAM